MKLNFNRSSKWYYSLRKEYIKKILQVMYLIIEPIIIETQSTK